MTADPGISPLAGLVFSLAAQTIAVQKRLDCQYAADAADFAHLLHPLLGTPAEAAAMALAPSPTAVMETTVTAQLATGNRSGSEFRIGNTAYARRFRARETLHTLAVTARRVPFTPALARTETRRIHGQAHRTPDVL